MFSERTAAPRQDALSESEKLLYFGIAVFVVLFGGVVWIACTRYHLYLYEILEPIVDCALILTGIGYTVWYFVTLHDRVEKQWPRADPRVPLEVRRGYLRTAAEEGTTYLGTDSHKVPQYWTRKERMAQTIVVGASGSGKTWALENIAQQDIAQGEPLVFLDGKGDIALVERLIEYATSVGRIQDVYLISPELGQLSHSYNPLPASPDAEDEHLSFIFNALGIDGDPFYTAHQQNYFNNIGRVLYRTGQPYTITNLLHCMRDETALVEAMRAAQDAEARNPSNEFRANALNMSINALAGSLKTTDRIEKLQNLLNKLEEFVSESVARIVLQTENTVTFSDLFAQRKILIVSLNLNLNSSAARAIGRMMISNLQAEVGLRYSERREGARFPFISVILDEFAPFAFPNFKTFVQQARDSAVAVIMSMQSSTQLRVVSDDFAEEVASAPGNKLALRITDENTSKLMANASGNVLKQRPNFRVRRAGIFSKKVKEEDSGTLGTVHESVIEDQWLKYQPDGQCEMLLPNIDAGQVHRHIHMNIPVRAHLGALLARTRTGVAYDPQIPGWPVPIFPKKIRRGTETGMKQIVPQVNLADLEREAKYPKRGQKR